MAKSDLAGYGEEYYDQRYRLSGTGFDIAGSGLYSQAIPGPSGYIVGYDTAFGDARYALSGSGGGAGQITNAGSGLVRDGDNVHVQTGSGLYLLDDEVGADIPFFDARYALSGSGGGGPSELSYSGLTDVQSSAWASGNVGIYNGTQWIPAEATQDVSLTGEVGISGRHLDIYDTETGGTTLTTTFQPLDFTSQRTIDTAAFSHSTITNPSEITVLESGVYDIDANATFDSLGGRSIAVIKLQRDTGGGFSDITGTLGFSYHRNTGDGEMTASTFCAIFLDTGDKIRLVAAENTAGDGMETKGDRRLRMSKHATPGSNTTINRTINITTGGGTTTNAGSGLIRTGDDIHVQVGSGLYLQDDLVGFSTNFGDDRYALSGVPTSGSIGEAGSGLVKDGITFNVQVGSGLYLLPDEVGVDIDSLDNRYVQQDSEEAESMYVFGAASVGISTTTSTTYVQKLKNTFTARHDGFHRVDWYMEVANTGAAGVAARIQLDDTATLGEVGPFFPGASIPFPWGGMAWVNLTSGVSYDLDLDYRSTGGTAVTRSARISCEHVTLF